jgi:hypothetical protein
MVQLPAVNTPQFDWIRTRIPRQPKPIGAIYQPEVAALAIWFAAHTRRKEIVVGAPAIKAIMADKLASGLFDEYLARSAVEGQQDQRPVSSEIQDNLFEPVSGDHGAHGRFGTHARSYSPLLWASMNRGFIVAAIAAGAAALRLSMGRRPRA